MGIISWGKIQLLCNMLKSYNKARKIAVLIIDKLQIIFREDIWIIRCSRLGEMGLLHSNLRDLRDLCNATDGPGRHNIYNMDDDNLTNDDSVVCFDDLDGEGKQIGSIDISSGDNRSCETGEIILKSDDKIKWANGIVNEGLNKLVFGSFLDRDFIGWVDISNTYGDLGSGTSENSGNNINREGSSMRGDNNNNLALVHSR